MRLLRFVLLIALSAYSVHSFAQAQTSRLGSVLTCEMQKGCAEEVAEGRHYMILETAQFRVRVAVQADGKYHRADVTVENRSSIPVRVNPSDFRIEVEQPKFRRLSYIEPEKLKLPKQKSHTAPQPKPAVMMGSSFMATTKDEPAAIAEHPFMLATMLAPQESASGRVYFEISGGSGMSLILPLSGTIFEFPFVPRK